MLAFLYSLRNKTRNMSRNSMLGIGILVIAGIGVLGWAYMQYPTWRMHARAAACASEFQTESERMGCWYRLIDTEVERAGISAATKTFAHLYDAYDEFAGSGCHKHAHKLGDTIYYNVYLNNPDIDALEFPDDADACGYGAFHGFLEHLIQDNPDPAFVTDVCTRLNTRLKDKMGDIRAICYHGSGHGFMLARVEQVPESIWGDLAYFVKEPLAQCEQLTEAEPGEKEECRQGIFNVIINWAEGGEYGFEYDIDNPLRPCDSLPQAWRHACYYEYAQKLDGIARRDLEELWDVAQSIRDKEHAEMVFAVATAGLIQQTVVSHEYKEKLPQCFSLSEPALTGICVTSLLWGLFEHGPPGHEYVEPIALCSDPSIIEHQFEQKCYEDIGKRLRRFYDAEYIEHSICPLFPKAYRAFCKAE